MFIIFGSVMSSAEYASEPAQEAEFLEGGGRAIGPVHSQRAWPIAGSQELTEEMRELLLGGLGTVTRNSREKDT